jgi:outer membrane protein assembly factor BamB
VGEIVVMRTPDQVIGLDFEQGKVVWVFPSQNSLFDHSTEYEDALPANMAEEEQRRQLRQRIWEDAPYGQLSSDGEAVYFVHDLGFAFEGMRQTLIQQGGGRVINPNFPKAFNQLVALDLRREGALRWVIDGKTGEHEPRLTGAFFLGPPLPLSGQLYVLAEINAEIRLVVLDAATGQLQWAQQLAHVDPSGESILVDAHRRLAGATPSFADGVLICPTSAGAVVAVDIAARSLLWGYQYQRNNLGQEQIPGMAIYPSQPRETGKRWADGLAVVADGRVLVTPVESDYLHCLDLLTGEMVWQQPRGESLFVGGVSKGKSVVVGKTHVTTYDLRTGKMLWEQEVGLPTGRGFVSNGHYYQPVYHTTTTEAGEQSARFELSQVNLETSEVTRVEIDRPLGNLICHRDQIVSQGAQWVGSLYQVEPLRKVVEARLAKNADDPWAVSRQAQLLRHDGKEQEALAALQRAHGLAPEDEYTRQLLIDTMLQFLADDFAAHREYVAEIQRLDPAADQRSEYLRLLIGGYQKTGEPEKAFEACLKLASLELEEGIGAARAPMDQIGAHLTVRRDRWIRARMKELIDSAEGERRTAIDQTLTAKLDEALATDTPSALSRFVNYFGSHPSADRARLRLAEKLMESSSLLEAELLLVRLEDSADPTIAAPANLNLAKLMARAQRWGEAAGYYRRLQQRWPDSILEDGLTASQIVANLPAEGPLADALRGPRLWPAGRVESNAADERTANINSFQKVYPIELTQVRGGLPPGARLAYDQQQVQLQMRGADGQLLSSVFVTNPHQSLRYPLPSLNSSVYHAKANGHLLLVSFGVQVIAFNLLEDAQPAGDSMLWKEDMDHTLDGNLGRQIRVNQLPQHNPWGDPRYFAAGSNSKPIGRFGPLSEHGVCIQRRSELVCVNPLTGEAIWTRENIEPGSDIFGDDDYIIVIPHEGRQAMVLGALDGSLVGYRDVPSRSNRWTTLGRRILSFRQEGRAMKVRMFDPVEASSNDWERSYAVESKGCIVERDKLAVMEPSGKFTLVSLEDGKPVIDTQLAAPKSLQSIQVLASADQYLLFTNSSFRENGSVTYQPPGIPEAPLVNGHVYAFHRDTGKQMWPSPAYVEQWGLPLDQPTGTPVVLLMRREVRTSGQQRNVLAVMCLDRRDGSLIFEKNDLAANAGTANDKYTLEANPTASAVDLVLPYIRISLNFTDQPEPPQPPIEAVTVGDGGVVNPGLQAAGALFRVLGGAPPPVQFVPPVAPALPRGVRINAQGQVVPLFPPGAPQPPAVPAPAAPDPFAPRP